MEKQRKTDAGCAPAIVTAVVAIDAVRRQKYRMAASASAGALFHDRGKILFIRRCISPGGKAAKG